MHVLFLQDNGINESLLLTELSAVLRAAGHHTSLLLEREEPDLRGAVEDEKPDLIFLPTSIRGHHWVLETCRRLRRWFPGVPRVLAGSHPTFYPEILQFDEVEMILVGEVEQATLDLLAALAGRRRMRTIPNLHLKRGKTVHRNPIRSLVADLDTLPLPHRGLYYRRYPFMAAFPWKKFTSGRGCFHNCSYCYQPSYREMCQGKGKYIRRKSPERVVAELEAVRKDYPLGNAHFSDDLFITDPRWLRRYIELTQGMAPLPYTINCSADLVSAQTAELLARSGCRAVAIGVETADQGRRRSILGKEINDETIRNAARQVREHGMTLVTFSMLAAPGETIQDAVQTLRFNASIGADHARVGLCFPIPGTEMARQALTDGECIEGFGQDIHRREDILMSRPRVFFRSAAAQESQLINLLRLFSLGISFPWAIPVIERLVCLPPSPLFALGRLHCLLKEKQLFGFSLAQGVRYFRHVGWPEQRTSNFVSLV